MQLNKVLQLKIAAMMLFWFGIYGEFLALAGFSIQYYRHGIFEGNTLEQFFAGGIYNVTSIEASEGPVCFFQVKPKLWYKTKLS